MNEPPEKRARAQAAVVLVVDPAEDGRRILVRVLSTAGYAALAVGSTAEAREALASRAPDAVVIAGASSNDDALALARWMRSEAALAPVPLLMIAAAASAAEQARALREGGFSACLLEPLVPAELTARLRSLLSRRSGA